MGGGHEEGGCSCRGGGMRGMDAVVASPWPAACERLGIGSECALFLRMCGRDVVIFRCCGSQSITVN